MASISEFAISEFSVDEIQTQPNSKNVVRPKLSRVVYATLLEAQQK
jgi:hypothetical protein